MSDYIEIFHAVHLAAKQPLVQLRPVKDPLGCETVAALFKERAMQIDRQKGRILSKGTLKVVPSGLWYKPIAQGL